MTTILPGGTANQPAAQAAPAQTGGNVTLTWITPAEVGPERDFYTGFAQNFEKQNPTFGLLAEPPVA